MKLNNLKGSLILILASLIWGLAFVAQTAAVELVEPFCLNALRSFVGAIALYIFYIFTNRKSKAPFFPKDKETKKQYLLSALICGTLLAISVNFQQFGLAYYPKGVASEARAGFLTALYVILVPIFSYFLGKKIRALIWVGVIIAIFGIYKLCFNGSFNGIYLGDILVFLCAISFSFHILAIDKFVGITGGIKLSIMQFAVCGVISSLLSLIFEFESVAISGILTAAPQILYLGIMSSGVAYTLQIIGQKFAEPAIASISMSLESVFAALGGWLISGNILSKSEVLGCVLVFIAITVAQLPSFKEEKTA